MFKRDSICMPCCSRSNDFEDYLLNLYKMENYILKNQNKPLRRKPATNNEYSGCQQKSKSYKMLHTGLDTIQVEKSRRRNIFHRLHMSNNLVFLFIMVLFCCWNSVVFAFHLNEESNSVYPKVKSISSSSFSHKRRSKTVEVFYPSGVSFDLFFIIL